MGEIDDYKIVFEKISLVTKNYLGLFQEFDSSNKDIVFAGPVFRQLYYSGSAENIRAESQNAYKVFETKIINALKSLFDIEKIKQYSHLEDLFSHECGDLYNKLSKYFGQLNLKNKNLHYSTDIDNNKIWEKWFCVLGKLCEETTLKR